MSAASGDGAWVSAYAPASVGNVGVGFDILGHVIEGAGDTVSARRTDVPGVCKVGIEFDGVPAVDLPTDPERNTASVAVAELLAAADADFGVELKLSKGIAMGSGMGGSAASSVAALVAANALLDAPLPREALYPFSVSGEATASGGRHGDNVAPMLLGGLVLAVGEQTPLRLPVPADLYCALVHPHHVVETREARAALSGPIDLHTVVEQSGNLALLLSGCFSGDFELIRRGLDDVLIEPRRAALVPGFAKVKQVALDAGALGSSISGGGPSVFAWCRGRSVAERCAEAMQAAFRHVGLCSDPFVAPVDGEGARLI